MAPRIVVAGSANMDLVGLADRLPRPGETVLGDDFVMMPGGKGANQAIAAARAGGHTVFLGAIGSDAFGVTLNARLNSAGVDMSYVRTTYGASGVAVIMVAHDSGENAILVAPGANNSFTALSDDEEKVIRDGDVLVCQQEIPMATVVAAARAARAGNTRTILNAAPARALTDELLANVDLLVVNQVEAEALTDGTGEMSALLALVPRVVLTRGGAGSRYADRDGRDEHIPAYRVEVADSTAAGDAFTGALAVAWGEDRDLVEAVRWANAAGAACVRKVGAYNALPTRQEIDAIYQG